MGVAPASNCREGDPPLKPIVHWRPPRLWGAQLGADHGAISGPVQGPALPLTNGRWMDLGCVTRSSMGPGGSLTRLMECTQ